MPGHGSCSFARRVGRPGGLLMAVLSLALALALDPAASLASARQTAERVELSAYLTGSFQGDCGDLTCTVRLDRAQTKNARDVGAIIGIAAGACGAVSAGTLALVCGASAAPSAGAISVAANRVYDDGDCIQFKFLKAPVNPPPPAVPGRVKHGTRNCQ